MRRFLTLVCLLMLAIPVGVSFSGCTRNPAANTCNGHGYGLTLSNVDSIILQPELSGISLAYGQTATMSAPTILNCKGSTISVGTNGIAWATTNNQLVDISPTGQICAGTWNRNTGGGIADYTYCNAPNPLPSTGGHPYGVAYVSVTAQGVDSNPVEVWVHPTITSVSLVGPSTCLSQGQTAQLDADAYYDLNGVQTLLCAPNSSTVPDCSQVIGTLAFNVGTPAVATINAVNNQITAKEPGTTAITASIASTGAAAGYFSTCPPQSISVTLANGATSGTIAQGTPQNLTTTVLDTNGNPITGLALAYQSTNPIDITSAGGTITTSSPGVAAVNAICEPTACNPAPINEFGLNGTGLSISSNPVDITVPGTASDYVYFSAPGQSRYFVPYELLTGTLGSTVRLPYVPNSMVMAQTGTTIFFGSPRELMAYNTSTDSLVTPNPSVPGIVLAVSPNGAQALINDQERHLFYLYNTSTNAYSTFPGMGNAAMWTPDSQTLYITDNANLNTPPGCPTQLITGHTDTLYVYNEATGWSTYALPPSPLPPDAEPSCSMQPNVAPPILTQTPAITIPGVGAYLRGDPTIAHTWCPAGTVGNTASMTFYPQGDSESVQSDALSATFDGKHILSAEWMTGGGITLSDIDVTIPGVNQASGVITPAECPVTTTGSGASQVQTLTPLFIKSSYTQTPVTSVDATAVNQVVAGATPVAAGQTQGTPLAFITYTGSTSGALLPYYVPGAAGAAGTLNYVTLSGSANITAPLVGAFSPDNSYFLVSTAGDNEVHFISIPNTITSTSAPTDTKQVSPNLPACTPVSQGGNDAGCIFSGSGTVVPATAIAVKPRPVT
jgi:hypothetical protein